MNRQDCLKMMLLPPVRKISLIAALVAGLGVSGWAHAGLGRLRQVSAPGQPFEAVIPVEDEAVGPSMALALADRNRYPILSPYTASAAQLRFNPVYSPEGVLTEIRVRGPARFDEGAVRFAVELSWPSGRVVREYEVDPRAGGQGPAPSPSGKSDPAKHGAAPDPMARISSLGLGELRIKSRIGESLEAELELFGLAVQEDASVQATLFPNPELVPPGSEAEALIASMSIQLKRSGGKQWLMVRSSRPVNEPVIGFGVEVRAASLRALKQFTLLVDPLGYQVQERTLTPAPHPFAEPVRATRRAVEKHHVPAAGAKVYRVVAGDTLSAIAARTEGGGSLTDTMRRLYQSNPEAFIAGDMHRLKAGAALHYPAHWAIADGGRLPELASSVPPKSAPAVEKIAPAKSAPSAAVAPEAKPATAVPEPVPPKKVDAAQAERLQKILAEQDQRLSRAAQQAEALEARLRALKAASTPMSEARSAASSEPVAAQAFASPAQPASVPAATPAKPVAPVVVPPAPVESPEPTIEEATDYTRYLAAGATGTAALLLAGGALWGLSRRRRETEQAVPPEGPASNLHSRLTTHLGLGEGFDIGPADVLAEADVYLAYGRTDQALDILREALAKDPMRQDVRYRILEILAGEPDKTAFIDEARAVVEAYGPDSTFGQRVRVLGAQVAPGLALFAGPAAEEASAAPVSGSDIPGSAQVAAERLSEVISSRPVASEVPSLAEALGVAPAAQTDLSVQLPNEAVQSATTGEAPTDEALAWPGAPLPGADTSVAPASDADPLADLPPLAPAAVNAPRAAVLSPEDEEKRALAKLYMEMGDTDTAEALLREVSHS